MSPLNLHELKNSSTKVQLSRISHVYQKHPDLAKWAQFAHDFGFIEEARHADKVYYRGFGKDPYCIVASASRRGKKEFDGAAFMAKTEGDFEKAKAIAGAQLVDISQAPGGGKIVSIPTPTGNVIHVIWGQQERDSPRTPPSRVKITNKELNKSLSKARHG
jgi:hypothetical protein